LRNNASSASVAFSRIAIASSRRSPLGVQRFGERSAQPAAHSLRPAQTFRQLVLTAIRPLVAVPPVEPLAGARHLAAEALKMLEQVANRRAVLSQIVPCPCR
jgi:hypothetical protein